MPIYGREPSIPFKGYTMGHIVRGTTSNKGNEQIFNGSPEKGEARFTGPQRTSGTRHRLQERVLQTLGICRHEFRQRSRQTQVYKWLHLSFCGSTYLMRLIASIAHGFKHYRKRASGYHPLYEGSLPHSRPTT